MLASARHYTIGIIPTVDVGKLVAWLRKVDPVFSFHSVLQVYSYRGYLSARSEACRTKSSRREVRIFRT